MVVSPKGRLVCDPSLGVSDLMEPLKEHMLQNANRNVEALLQVPKGTSFKTAPAQSGLLPCHP